MSDVTHYLRASELTTQWGYLDGGRQPAIEIASGQRVMIDTISGSPAVTPTGSGWTIPVETAEIHSTRQHFASSHILTGPVKVAGVASGDLLQVDIEEIKVRTNWGWSFIRPLAGMLPDQFSDYRLLTLAIDRDRGYCEMPWGTRLTLQPFFGIMAVAPRTALGRLPSAIPGPFGGNLDNRELTAGTSVFFPVFEEGGLFVVGDGHGLQGDGEACGTAVETGLTGVFTFHRLTGLQKELGLNAPVARTATHWITSGLHASLDAAAQSALKAMISLLIHETTLSPADAYQLCSFAADLRITQAVNYVNGVHAMLGRDVVDSLSLRKNARLFALPD